VQFGGSSRESGRPRDNGINRRFRRFSAETEADRYHILILSSTRRGVEYWRKLDLAVDILPTFSLPKRHLSVTARAGSVLDLCCDHKQPFRATCA
jgi:hypothetical protein